MPEIIPSYTQCLLKVGIKKDFQLRLHKPNEKARERFSVDFGPNSFEIDGDDDIKCSGGKWSAKPEVVIKDIILYLSQQTIAVRVLRGTTDDCFGVLYQALAVLYGVTESEVNDGIDYTTYQTTTRVKLQGSLLSIFSPQVQSIVAGWQDLPQSNLVNSVAVRDWRNEAKGLVDMDPERYELLWEGVRSALVIPSTIQFTIWLTTKFSKNTKYQVKIVSDSVEDFEQNAYFVETEFPFEKHVELLAALSEQRRC